jgi:putative GTP pyrophosphokinase
MIEEFLAKRELYERLAAAIVPLLERLASQAGVSLIRIESRVKEEESLREKVSRPEKAGKYTNLEDVTDLCGLRLITYSNNDCAMIADEIRRHFSVDETNSVDKAQVQDPDRFGYLSTHLVVSLTEERSKLFEYEGLSNLRAEIQIRTALQHAWASLDWKMRYKSEVEVPRELRRRLFRISALLETADEAFASLEKSAEDLRASYSKDVRGGRLEIPVNRDSLSAFMANSKLVASLFERCRDAGIPIVGLKMGLTRENERPWTNLIRSLAACSVLTLEALEAELLAVTDANIADLKSVKDIYLPRGTFGVFTPLRILILSRRPLTVRQAVLRSDSTPGALSEALERVLLASQRHKGPVTPRAAQNVRHQGIPTDKPTDKKPR